MSVKIISIFEVLKGFQFTGVRLAGLELPDLSPKKEVFREEYFLRGVYDFCAGSLICADYSCSCTGPASRCPCSSCMVTLKRHRSFCFWKEWPDSRPAAQGRE